MQFNKTVIRCLGTALHQVKKAEVTQEMRLPDGMPDIGRVLTSWGQAIIRSKQWQGNSIQLSGGVMVWTLYAPEDGTEPRSVDSWIPFQISWDVEDVGREGPMRMLPLLRFADSRSISARKLMLRAGVSAMVQALYPMDAQIYSPGEVPEDVQLLRRAYPVLIPMEGGEKTFLADEEISLPDLGSPADILLSLIVQPEITEKRILSDKVVFKGMLNVHMVCRHQDGQVRSTDQSVPFSQLSELDTVYGTDAQADIQMAVTSLETDMAEPGKVRMKCGLVAQYLVSDCHILELVQDAYSPKREVETGETALKIPVVLDERTEYLMAEQALPGQNGRVADALFLVDFPREKHIGDASELELSGLFQSLIYDEEGTLHGNSTRWEGMSQLRTDEWCSLWAVAKPTGKVQAMAAMDAIAMSSQIQLAIRTIRMDEIPMVTALELGQAQEPEAVRPSVILTEGAGERLWDIAKRSNSTVAAICTANGIDCDTAPEGMILIPVI